MIYFRRKIFSEFDAMRSLYVELSKLAKDPRNPLGKINVIDESALIPVLRGNNIVIERFVISTSTFGKDKYRMYLKIGAKAKLPDSVKLPSRDFDKKVGNLNLNLNNSVYNEGDKFVDKKSPSAKVSFSPEVNLTYRVTNPLGEVIKYDKASRSLILEFSNISDAIKALDILPFGIGYKIYLLS